MRPAEFERSPSGRLVPTVYGQKAFVPHPLPPPTIDYGRCIADIDRASRAMAELKGMSHKVTNPTHLINPLQKMEAIASSSIEGTYTTPSQLLLFDSPHGRASKDPDVREVSNYVDALHKGLDLLSILPVSSRLIREMHRQLLQGVTRSRGSEIVPGEFKRDQNFIGAGTRNIEDARFVPPPPDLTSGLMSDLEKFINSEQARRLPPVLMNALVHYQFETIHPFPDGNGRVGRLLVPLILASQDVMPIPLLYTSPFIEKNKDEYNDLMLNVSKTGAWEPWICFFSASIEHSAIDTISKINQIAQLRDEFIHGVRQARVSGLLPLLIDIVFDRLIITIPEAKNRLNVTYAAAKNNIDRLVKLDILRELNTSTRPKVYVCPRLISLVFDIH